jgi:predicted AlkP superfamily pyrophosphatase or phosphodiesterase
MEPFFQEFVVANMISFRHLVASLVATLTLANGVSAESAAPNAQPLPGVKHVLLVGFDGFGAYAWNKAEMPHLKALAAEGSFSLETRTVLPSSSGPNWSTHLMGAGPELTGFTSNSPIQSPSPRVIGKYGRFPGIYGLIRDAYPKAETGAFYDWGRIHDLIESKAISVEKEFPRNGLKSAAKRTPQENVEMYERSAENTAAAAAKYIATKKPLFTFVYFASADEAGHVIGHDTPEYYAILKKNDDRLGRLLDTLKTAGIEKETVVIVIADHGGVNKGHGGKTLLEVQTPWVIYGPGVKRGHVLKSSVVHYDTSATIAHALGLTPPQVWVGRPVLEAFSEK